MVRSNRLGQKILRLCKVFALEIHITEEKVYVAVIGNGLIGFLELLLAVARKLDTFLEEFHGFVERKITPEGSDQRGSASGEHVPPPAYENNISRNS